MDKKRLIIILVFVVIFIISILLSIFNYKGKYSVSFETGTNDVFLTKYVEKGNKVKQPINPEKDGYVFKEWQLDGETYNFDDIVKSNIVLTAKWVKEEYVTVYFESEEEKIDSKRILKGQHIEDLPIINRDNYDFIGWFLNDKLYNSEDIYNDITLVAKFKMNKLNTNYKIGSKVKIIGSYAESSISEYTYHSVAIGWEREILYIFEDREFPYMVGNQKGVTGFFKAESLELK